MSHEIHILYEDADIIAIDKPAGVLVHADGKRTPERETVVEWLLRNYPQAQGVGEEAIVTQEGVVIDRSGVVHRLDRDTSGVMLLAKTAQGHQCLKEQFQNRTIHKTYQALVYGTVKEDHYEVQAPIGRSRTFAKWSAIPKAIRGTQREASTSIRVLERFEGGVQGYSLIRAEPKTGRTHQIRVHLQYLNYPIVADALYAGKRNNPKDNLGFSSQALHAERIIFVDCQGESHQVEAALPPQFTQAIGILKNRSTRDRS